MLIGRCPTTADIFSAALLVACAMCPGVNRSIQIQVGSESYKETLELMNDDVMLVGLGKDNPDMVPRIVFKTIAVQTLEEHWIVLS